MKVLVRLPRAMRTRSKFAVLGLLLPLLGGLLSVPLTVQALPFVGADFQDYTSRMLQKRGQHKGKHVQVQRSGRKAVKKIKRRARHRHHPRAVVTPTLMAGAGSVIIDGHSPWPLQGLGDFDGPQASPPNSGPADAGYDDSDMAEAVPGDVVNEDQVAGEDDGDDDGFVGEPPTDFVEFGLQFVEDESGPPPTDDPPGTPDAGEGANDEGDGDTPVLVNALLLEPIDLGPFDEPPPADSAAAPTTRSVPEPGALVLVGVALLAATRRSARARR